MATILPLDYLGKTPMIELNISISAKTNEKEYRCRKFDEMSITITEAKSNKLIYYDWNSEPYGQNADWSEIREDDIRFLIDDIYVTCPSGKYPQINFRKYENFVDETESDMYEDKGRGYICVEYKAYIAFCNHSRN